MLERCLGSSLTWIVSKFCTDSTCLIWWRVMVRRKGGRIKEGMWVGRINHWNVILELSLILRLALINYFNWKIRSLPPLTPQFVFFSPTSCVLSAPLLWHIAEAIRLIQSCLPTSVYLHPARDYQIEPVFMKLRVVGDPEILSNPKELYYLKTKKSLLT